MKKAALTIFFLIGIAFSATTTIDSVAQRRDGSMFIDIWYSVENLDGDSLVIKLLPITEANETLYCETFISPSDTGLIIAEGQHHIIWDFGTDVPDREFFDNQIQMTLVGEVFGKHPFACGGFCMALSDTIENFRFSSRHSSRAISENGVIFAYSYFNTLPDAEYGLGSIIVKINELGIIEWTKHIVRYGVFYIHRVIDLGEEGSIVAGYCRGTFFTHLDINGNIISSFLINHGILEGLYVKTSDNSILYLSQLDRGSEEYEIYLMKVSMDGELLWSKAFYSSSIDDMIEDSDGNILISGRYDREGVEANYLMKLNHLGEYIWAKSYSPLGLIYICESLNDGYWLSYGLSSHTRQNGIMRIDHYGNPLWAKAICDSSGGNIKIKQFADSTTLIASMTFIRNGDYDLLIYKINQAGDILWSKIIGGEGNDYFSEDDFAINSHGLCYLLAYTYHYHGTDKLILSTIDSRTGYSCCSEDITLEATSFTVIAEDFDIEINDYPVTIESISNPISEDIYIEQDWICP